MSKMSRDPKTLINRDLWRAIYEMANDPDACPETLATYRAERDRRAEMARQARRRDWMAK